jgi:uncharacterized protein
VCDAVGASWSAPAGGVVGRLGELAAALRERGVRVGVGELLAAVRALDAVDVTSREDARLGLRTVLCSDRTDLPRFDAAFLQVFGDELVAGDDLPPGDLAAIERAVPPRMGVTDEAGGRALRGADPSPAAWSEVELLREKDFARFTPAE